MVTNLNINQDYTAIDRPYDNYLERSNISLNDGGYLNDGTQTTTSSVSGLTNNSGATEVLDGSINNGSVETQPVKSDGGMADLWINNLLRSTNWKPKKVGFMIDGTSGYAEFTSVYISGHIQALSGTIGGWTIEDTKLSTSTLLLDGGNQKIESTNYSSGPFGSGFHLDSNLLEVGNITARGVLRSAVFQKDVISTVGGNLAVLNGDVLDVNMTALDNSPLTIKGTSIFANGDKIRIKDGIYDEWMTIATNTLVDYYPTTNYNSAYSLNSATSMRIGQTFYNPITANLSSCKFYLYKVGAPTGNAYAELHAFTGVYGGPGYGGPATSSIPLATSGPLDVSTLSTSTLALKTFTFTGVDQVTLTADTHYCIILYYNGGNASNLIAEATDSTSPTHGGQIVYTASGIDPGVTWYQITTRNSIFYIYATPLANTYGVTRDLASVYAANENPAWTKGATVVNYGQSGDGGVYMTASESNAPYLSIFDHHGEPWKSYDSVTAPLGLATRLRIGNLNGFLGYSTDLYGIAIGETTKYLKYDTSGGLQIKGDITITNPEDISTSTLNNNAGWTSDASLNAFISGTYATDLTNIQNQIDGVVVNWFYDGVPTLDNLPASEWKHIPITVLPISSYDGIGTFSLNITDVMQLEDIFNYKEQLKEDHIGDLYYDTDSGLAYRFVFDVDNTYKWLQIPDSSAAALAAAAAAQDTADNKRRVFTITPFTPYDVGDLWLTSVADLTGDLKKCITAKATGAYDAANWVIATKYTDDTTANQAILDAATAQTTAETAQTTADGKINTFYQLGMPHLEQYNIPDDVTYNSFVGDMWYQTDTKQTWRYSKVVNGGNFDYLFLQQNIPVSIFDTIDGKNTIFTAEPTIPYYLGDMWLTSLTATTGDLKKCITERTTGVYTAADWVIATKYTEGADWTTNLSGIPTVLGTPSGTGLFLGSTNMGYYTGGAWKTYIDNSGNMVLGDIAGGNTGMAWNQSGGTLTIKGVIKADTGYIGGTTGWTIATGYIKKDTGVESTSTGLAPLDYPFYAGAQYANRATAPFRVSNAGVLTATGVNISGAITATSGSFSGTISIGSSNSIFKADLNGIYLGSSTFASAPFRVDMAGNLTATSVTISGLAVGTNVAVGSQSIYNALDIIAGSVEAENITGTTITGKTVQTSSSGIRVILAPTEAGYDENDSIVFANGYTVYGSMYGYMYAQGGGVEIDAGDASIYMQDGTSGTLIDLSADSVTVNGAPIGGGSPWTDGQFTNTLRIPVGTNKY